MFRYYLSLCWLSSDPADLPVSKPFLWKNIAFYLIVGLFIQANIIDPVEAFIQVFIELFLSILFICILLAVSKSFKPFERVLTGFIFCENFIYAWALPVAIWYIAVKETDYSIYPAYAAVVLVVWSIVIIAYLLRGVFSYGMFASTLLSIVYFVSTYLGSLGLISM